MPAEKLCFVWSCSRMKKISFLADSLDSLKHKGCMKLGIWSKKMDVQKVRTVLEKCGTEIDEDDVFQTLGDPTTFILLAEGQLWFPRPPIEEIFADLIQKSRISNENSTRTEFTDATKGSFDHHGRQLVYKIFTENLYMRMMQMSLLILKREDLEAIVDVEANEMTDLPYAMVEELQVAASLMLLKYDKTQKTMDLLYSQASKQNVAEGLNNEASFR